MIEPKITFDQYTGIAGFRSQVKELTTAERQKKKRKRRISRTTLQIVIADIVEYKTKKR